MSSIVSHYNSNKSIMTTCVTKNAYLIYKFTNPSIPDGARVQVRTTGLGQKRDSENGIRKTGLGKRDSENGIGRPGEKRD
jgi:hypothetical protein